MRTPAGSSRLIPRKMDRIIFLDVDGVLNSEAFFTSASRDERETMIDGNAVKLLNRLDGAKVVITSSWGEDAISALRDKGLELPIIGCTKKVHHQFNWACRGNEIEEWIYRTYGDNTYFGKHDRSKYEYVILDDDKDMLLGQIEHFIYVDRKTGLVEEDINLARHILEF